MRLSVEVLNHIFSFLVSHRETLIACSNDPVLFPIVERHLYYHIIVHLGEGSTNSNHAFEPDCLSKLISKNPCILNYVRKLELQVEFPVVLWRSQGEISYRSQLLDHFAKTLVMFPDLECIILTNPSEQIERCWHWTDKFRDALEDRLKLPTLTELHLIGDNDLPSSVLDNCKNIKYLSLLGAFSTYVQVGGQNLPQLNSLTFSFGYDISTSLLAWIKLHINELRFVKCTMSTVDKRVLSELLGMCPPTLRKLDVDIKTMHFCSEYSYPTGEIIRRSPSLEISPIPSKLQQLIIRTIVAFSEPYEKGGTPECCMSWLPAAADAINSFIPSLQHLVLDIDIHLSSLPDLTEIDFSPLEILGVASLSIPRIDLYVHTGVLTSALTRAQLLASLEDDEGVMRSIEEGVLVIYSEKTAPE